MHVKPLVYRLIPLTLMALLLGYAWAQEANEVPTDIAAWFASSGGLAAVVAAITAWLKRRIEALDGLYVVAASLAIGTALGIAGHYLGHIDTITGGAAFGLSAGFLASGGWDLVKSFGNARTTPVAATDEAKREIIDALRDGRR